MSALDLTTFDAALKVHYTSDDIENLAYQDNPFLAMVPKYTKFGGKNLPIPIRYGTPQGRSASFAKAKQNKKASNYTDFVLTRAKDYSLASLDNETIDASQHDADAFLEAVESEVDGAIQSCGRSLATALFRDGSGSIGRTTETSGTTITLTDKDEVVNFEVGMEIYFTSDGTVSGLRDSGQAIGVIGVDRVAGVLTVDEDLSGITGLTANDYISVEGDAGAKVKGLSAWLVSGTVTSDPFFGVDRTVDRTRLAGVSYDGSSESIEEALQSAMSLTCREGGKPSHAFLNYSRWSDLEKSLGSKVNYVDHAQGDIGFRGIRIASPKGFVEVYADQNCQSDKAYLLDMRFWKLYSLGEAPKLLTSDGNKMLRETDADAVEVRSGYYAQLGCRAPGYNSVVTLAS